MATRKITLFDSEREIVVDIIVSEAEAARAERDVFFATELLRKAEASASVQVDQEFIEETSESFIEERLDSDNLNSETPQFEGETSVYRWNSPCVLLLLELYRSMEGTLNSGKISQKQVWNKISQDMKKKGYDVTGPQCHSKIRSLKKTYKSTKDHNNKSGNNRKTWQFYDIMDEIFGKKAWCNPVAVASSTGLSLKEAENNDSTAGSDSGCSLKTRKASIASLLEKRLHQKEEHEENKKKSHLERMKMDEKFLEVLEKLANK
ncbi:uncharacterized protein LOC125059859 [Pieris napi]|uniref:uncharacterized protein LOC125059859 n=1 Tax=Pieris napi TaxID=78633 RepID=UPI001FBA2330|nr:uncharacterized protein LOC125059859 [Pieris napi]